MVGLLSILTGCVSLERCQFTRICMGVQCRLTIYSANAAAAEESAKAAFARISEIDAAVSDYRIDSDVARLAASAGTPDFVPISSDTQVVLARSLELARNSGGAFDPTVGPLTKLWRQARQDQAMPDKETLREAAARVDFHGVQVKAGHAQLAHAGMSLDFGAIAKGYAAEEAVKVLRARGDSRCLVALSGDVFAGDAPPHSAGWRVAISSGQSRTDSPEAYVFLKNQGLSTSGDSEQFIELGGTRYSHVIDPRAGWAMTASRSVTVIGPQGWMHDGLSTALCVLDGPEAKELVEKYPNCAAIVFERIDNKVQLRVLGNSHLLAKIQFNSE